MAIQAHRFNNASLQQDNMLQAFCNGTSVFASECQDFVLRHGDELRSAASGQIQNDPWSLCHDLHYCQTLTPEVTRPSQPVTVFNSRRRTTILDPNIDGPVLGVDGLLQLEIETKQDFWDVFGRTPEEHLKSCARFGIIANERPRCPQDVANRPGPMTIIKDQSRIDKLVWRCGGAEPKPKLSVRHMSFFSDHHLTLEDILEVSYIWAKKPELKIENVVAELNGRMSKNTVVDLYKDLRESAYHW
jgi:hypothetical protein